MAESTGSVADDIRRAANAVGRIIRAARAARDRLGEDAREVAPQPGAASNQESGIARQNERRSSPTG